jgi:hypothetical protein
MSAAREEEFEVEDLDPAALLALAAANERELREREALKLRLAYQWAVMHPATADSGVETWGGALLPTILTNEESLGGDGTPAVAAFMSEAFATAIGASPTAGAQLIGDALDLHHRHPLLEKRVQRLEVPVWQARRVAQQTHRLPYAGARWVDQQLASRTDGAVGPIITDRLVAEAVATFDPEAHEEREKDTRSASDVKLNHPHPTDFAGASELHAHGDTLTLKTFHDLLCAIAHQRWLDGDTDPLGVRKIKAIALITALATSQAALDAQAVFGNAARKQAGKIRLHVRVDAQDIDTDAEDGAAFATGTVEMLGAATMAQLRQWVGHSQVVIQPVLNMQRRDAVDHHDPPPWMQELVRLRDGHCVFPRCQVDARDCDLDHEIPYEPDGPPGQTHPDNLACLCRRHHRAKTARVWRYARTPEGHYLWHGPYDTTYLVTARGTHRQR